MRPTMSTTNLGVNKELCPVISIVRPRTSIKICTATIWINLSRPASKLTYFQGALVYEVETHFVFHLFTGLYLIRNLAELIVLVLPAPAVVQFSLRRKRILSASTSFWRTSARPVANDPLTRNAQTRTRIRDGVETKFCFSFRWRFRNLFHFTSHKKKSF